MSLHSEPSARPRGFCGFKLSAVRKDPVLQQELQNGNPQLELALKASGGNPDCRLGALFKYALGPLQEDKYLIVSSYNISCKSYRGPIDPEEDYVGLVLYAKDGVTDWKDNGVHVKSGYIYFKKTSDIMHIVSSQGQVSDRVQSTGPRMQMRTGCAFWLPMSSPTTSGCPALAQKRQG
jgi:hypothetical protein